MEEAKARGGKFDGTIGFVPTRTSDTEKGGQIEEQHTVLFDGRQCEAGIVFYKKVGKTAVDTDEPSSGLPKIVIPSVGRYVTRTRSLSERRLSVLAYALVAVSVILPYIVIAALTRFQPRNSSYSERFWTISWLVVGQVAGVFVAYAMKGVHGCGGRASLLLPGVAFVVPAIGGLVTVATMMKEFGQCVPL
jgi:hypothetical protein